MHCRSFLLFRRTVPRSDYSPRKATVRELLILSWTTLNRHGRGSLQCDIIILANIGGNSSHFLGGALFIRSLKSPTRSTTSLLRARFNVRHRWSRDVRAHTFAYVHKLGNGRPVGRRCGRASDQHSDHMQTIDGSRRVRRSIPFQWQTGAPRTACHCAARACGRRAGGTSSADDADAHAVDNCT